MTQPAKPVPAPTPDRQREWDVLKDLILRLLPPMASLAAVSLAGVSLFHLHAKLKPAETLVDETLAFCAVLLMLCYHITIWAVRSKNMDRAFFLGKTTLVMFLTAVTLLVVAGCRMLFSF